MSTSKFTDVSAAAVKRVLCSGVTGQDGSYMADYLLANTPHQIYGMVRRTAKPDYGNLANALDRLDRFRLVTGDLSDSHSIDSLVKDIRPDYFINLAAQSFVKASWAVPEQTFDVDALGVLRCLEAIRRHVPHCRFYSAGSSEEFGAVEYSLQDEDHPMRPQSPYGAAKCASRLIVRVYRESYGLYAVQGTLFNHESERRGVEFVTRKITQGVARIAAAIRAGQSFEPLELGNLDAQRDWSHAEDFVDGIWRMLNQEPPPENVAEVTINGAPIPGVTPLVLGWQPQEYVLASGETHSIRNFVEKAFAAADIPGVWWNCSWNEEPKDDVYLLADREHPTLATKAMIPLVRINPAYFRPAEVELLRGDASRAHTELGWSPKVSFDDLVRRMVEFDMAAVEREQGQKRAA